MIFRMADACIAANILNLENRIQRLERRTDRRILREIEDPFDPRMCNSTQYAHCCRYI